MLKEIKKICYCCCKEPQVAPPIYHCVICFEEGSLRPCCKTVYCDYDYSKDQFCPNCKTSTKKEKLTGAVFMIAPFSEHEECRVCLGPGLKRRCCGNYYCDECYYKLPQCRSCGKPTANRGLNQQLNNRASLISVLLGWTLTIFLLLVVMSMIIILTTNEEKTPVGLSDYHCYGFFTECDTYVCIDVDQNVTTNKYTALPSLYDWKKCTLNSTSKIQSQACIYDRALYILTDGDLGYDICKDEFQQGAYVFEDTFEYWEDSTLFETNLMASATWNKTHNAATNSYCGVSKHRGGSKALVFSGDFYRYAITLDVDVSFGGWLEAELFLAPVGFDVKYPNCKTAYAGHISVEYSIDKGVTWELLEYYYAWKYRQEEFFPIKLEIPAKGRTKATRFRFIQKTFQADKDQWALDNVKVFHYFQNGWDTSSQYVSNLQKTPDLIQFAQCCFDTEWCETRMSESDLKKCDKLEWYKETNYQLRGTELYICIAVGIAIFKFVYLSIMEYIMKGRVPFNDELEELNQVDKLIKMLPPHWRPKNTFRDLYKEIHESARIDKNKRKELQDGPVKESEEEMKRRKEEEQKLKNIIAANRRKKEKLQKKLAKMNKRAAKVTEKKIREKKKERKSAWVAEAIPQEILIPGMDFIDEDTKTDDNPNNKYKTIDNNDNNDDDNDNDDEDSEWDEYGEKKLKLKNGPETDEKSIENILEINEENEEFKKKDLSLLIAIDIIDTPWIRWGFGITVMTTLALCFLYQSGTQADYTMKQDILVYGQYNGEVAIKSGGILIFALFLDAKEIYRTLRSMIPFYSKWIPQVTIDTTYDVNSLFIGNKTINLLEITEAHTFSSYFIIGNLIGYLLGCFPWAIFSMILRNQYLSFDIMRITIPMLGTIVMIRSILGPEFLIKSSYALYAVFNLTLKGREDLGIAFKADRTKYASINFAIFLACGCAFLLSIVALKIATLSFGVFLLLGLAYGSITGCSHSLPIKPWMIITTINEGIWLRLKEKKRCPCVYWCGYCTEMHSYEQVFVIFPRDQIKFLSKIKGNTETNNV